MATVEPLTKEERTAHRCAYCHRGITPQRIASVQDFPTFQTNRRVIKARKMASNSGEWWITYYPANDAAWGYDGLFCTLRHSQAFAHAAHRAGYRMKH